MDTYSMVISFIAIAYWCYLLDPFKRKPPFRLYKALLNNKKTLRIHLVISLAIATIAIIRIINAERDLFSFVPLLFITLVFIVNSISKKTNSRDFYLILRGEKLHNARFDILASIVVIVIPFLINFGIFVAFNL
ncbi:hypothetical protein ACFOWA_04580 [Pedobacter lithocola]|uniref:Uncharacterized protein n=1 Tax=Pedobacter lithocola TaxID=1908239 RepID=A0ABV8P6Y9_9SPHI